MTPTQEKIVGRIAKLKSEIKELWTDCATLRAENERLRQDRDELRRFAYEDAPKLAGEVDSARAAELKKQLAEVKAEFELHSQIYTRTDNDVAIVSAQLKGARQAGDTLKAQLAEANARAEGFQKVYEDALSGNQAILQREAEARHERDEWRERRDLAIVRAEEAEERAEKGEAEIERLQQELSYIANAKRESFESAREFRIWAQDRARHALGLKPEELAIKKGNQ